jgi:RNA polymerase sigma-70 factor (ECF subfamily)
VARGRHHAPLDRPAFPSRWRRRSTWSSASSRRSGRATQDALLALVAPDATWTSDDGGRVSAARKVIRGAVRIVRFALGVEQKWGSLIRHELAWINGEPAVATYHDEQLVFTTSFESDGERLVAFFRVLNPDKLKHAQEGTRDRL